MHKRFSQLISALICCATVHLSAQQAGVPLPGDPEIAFVFFNFHDALRQEIEKRKARDLPAGQSFELGILASLKLNAADFAKIAPISQAVNTELDALYAEAMRYKLSIIPPGTTAMRAFRILRFFGSSKPKGSRYCSLV